MNNCWWCEQSVSDLRPLSLRLGPLHIWVRRSEAEWMIAVHRDAPSAGGLPTDSALQLETLSDPAPPEGMPSERMAMRETSSALWIAPALPDRAVIVRTREPLFVPPGEEARLFLGIPLWIRLLTGPRRTVLVDRPVTAQQETWFGPSTREGEIAYASRIPPRLRHEDPWFGALYATTILQVRNRARTPFEANRLKVPAPHLSLFEDGQQRLWTESLTLTHELEAMVSIEIADRAPSEAAPAHVQAEPRDRPDRLDLLQSIGGFLRNIS